MNTPIDTSRTDREMAAAYHDPAWQADPYAVRWVETDIFTEWMAKQIVLARLLAAYRTDVEISTRKLALLDAACLADAEGKHLMRMADLAQPDDDAPSEARNAARILSAMYDECAAVAGRIESVIQALAAKEID